MPQRDVDAIVLGAGMVGIATALNLQARGLDVVLMDRRGPAEETSFGNAGLIQSEAVIPYAFPRQLEVIAGVLLGRRTDARIVWRDLPHLWRWILAYAGRGGAAAVARTAAANLPLLAQALPEHQRLLSSAGAEHLVRPGGYLRIVQTPAALDRAARAEAAVAERYGVRFAVWDRARLQAQEPHLDSHLAGAVHYPDPWRATDPGDVGHAYACLFTRRGGRILRGDARTLCPRRPAGWQVTAEDGVLVAPQVVLALGPWTGDLLAAQGVRVPMGVKRGYHRHYAIRGNAVLHHTVVDAERGLVLAPNRRGIRLTTGAEFARRDSPPSPVQLQRLEAPARHLFPLADALDPQPWLGARPCLPDLLPLIGSVPGRPGLWVNAGHHHLGFTLGPATGRLLAEMMTGQDPMTDPRPYRLDRF